MTAGQASAPDASELFVVKAQMSATLLADQALPLADHLAMQSRLTAARAGVELIGDSWMLERRTSYRLAPDEDGVHHLIECSPDEAQIVMFELVWAALPH